MKLRHLIVWYIGTVIAMIGIGLGVITSFAKHSPGLLLASLAAYYWVWCTACIVEKAK